jgi:GH24 family phage-related lysozyme (muramidase)
MDYSQYLNPLLKQTEGQSTDVYQDHNGNPTVGTGLNLGDTDVQNLMKLRNIDPDEIKSGQRKLATDEADDIQNAYMGKREQLVRGKMGSDLFDTLAPHEKAAIMSMGYQSLNNLGPNLTGHIANDDKIGAMREMILNTNKENNPGILQRRLKEAELYGGPLDFTSTFKTFTPDEQDKVKDMINSVKNENVKKEMMDKYGSYLGQISPVQFKKLEQMLNAKEANETPE